MKQALAISVITGSVAALAGVAIAGLPSSPPGEGLRIEAPATTTTTVPTATTSSSPTTSSTTVDDGVVSSAPDPTEPAVDATIAQSAATESTAPGGSAVGPAPVTTDGTPGDASDADATDAPAPGGDGGIGIEGDETTSMVAPGDLVVATANASGGVPGLATTAAARLDVFGYDAQPVDAEQMSDTSVVFFAPGLENEAGRLAQDLGWTIGDVAPMAELPPLLTERAFDLVALIGLDRA